MDSYQSVIQKSYGNGSIEITEENIQYLPMAAIAAARKDAEKGMDEGFQVILDHAYRDLEQGEISRDEYFSIFLTATTNNGGIAQIDTKDEVPENFWEYLDSNKEKISKDFSKDFTTNLIEQTGIMAPQISAYINEKTGKKGPEGSGQFIMLNSKVEKFTRWLRIHKQTIEKTGKWLGRGVTALNFATGMHEDLTKKDKSIGEATTHNVASTTVSVASGYLGSAAIAFALGSNPGGWAVLGGVAVGTVLSSVFNYAYDNNFLGIQDKLDYAGQQLDKAGERIKDVAADTVNTVKESAKDVGEAIEGGVKAINPMNWSWG
jgi:hypothetical protein